ncbi:membrane lipoprotein lipid attachment site-containing protein [Erysipelothrix sp. strain 2 (EsS2-6-Brazil)]|uniref:membrane lipoprotein lipid attachment site-containing protein n=1 Tax=Erysipelothrix sp. strain 2 (EsS2-6-Brazil) TaxID=2500549 RepID=UPI001909D290|nr:membrane lipoprotein lipid attachment site-containing protein [Erysipelothrix sp. strain 2 (EsS2-6-Brazil)]MBK2403212.1 hypothetical protein [Erysipelothrix sp. strain 2 (EsS2-6-Brazil)]
MKRLSVFLVLLLILTGCSDTPEKPEVVEPPVNTYETIAFKLGGKAYQLPVSYQTLYEDGWIPTTDIESISLASNSYTDGYALRKDRNIIWIAFFNPEDEEKMLEETLVASISAENRESYYDDPVDIIVHEGISFETPKETIIEQLGDYTEDENARFKNITFEHTKKAKSVFKFDIDSGRMEYIEITNYRKPRS